MTVLSNAAKQFYKEFDGTSITADSMVISMLFGSRVRVTFMLGGVEIVSIDSSVPVNFAAGETLKIDGVRVTMGVRISGGPQ